MKWVQTFICLMIIESNLHRKTISISLEYNVLQPSPLNEKVLRDKRKKLKETFDRVMRLYVRREYTA